MVNSRDMNGNAVLEEVHFAGMVSSQGHLSFPESSGAVSNWREGDQGETGGAAFRWTADIERAASSRTEQSNWATEEAGGGNIALRKLCRCDYLKVAIATCVKRELFVNKVQAQNESSGKSFTGYMFSTTFWFGVPDNSCSFEYTRAEDGSL